MGVGAAQTLAHGSCAGVDSCCPSFGEAFPAASALPSRTRCLPWDGAAAPLPICDTQGLSQLYKGKLLFIEDAGMLEGQIQGRMAQGTSPCCQSVAGIPVLRDCTG